MASFSSLKTTPPILKLAGSAPSYYYGYSVQFSGNPAVFYFTNRIERPDYTISCFLQSAMKTSGPQHRISITLSTLIERPSSSISVDSTQLGAELRANQEFLGKYSSIDGNDLAPELTQKLGGLEKRNTEIEDLHKQAASLSESFDHVLGYNDIFKKCSSGSATLIFDGFAITLFMRRAQI